jgi:hypothetical protein
MHNLNEKFTDEEYEEMLRIKAISGLSWHDFVIEATKDWMKCEKEHNY